MAIKISELEILEMLKKVEDPELGVNIVDLGLIYNVNVDEDTITVEMTFTTPFCPFGASLQAQVTEVLESINGAKVELNIVFDPAWDRDMMNDEAKIELGLL